MDATKLVHPAPGVTIFTGGRGPAFEAGRPVPLPAAHADELVAAGRARHHLDPPPMPPATVSQPAGAPAPAAEAPVPLSPEPPAA